MESVGESLVPMESSESLDSALTPDNDPTIQPATVATTWASHEQSFAVLPMARVVGPSGYLAELVQRGYLVQSPDELAVEASADAGASADEDADQNR